MLYIHGGQRQFTIMCSSRGRQVVLEVGLSGRSDLRRELQCAEVIKRELKIHHEARNRLGRVARLWLR